MRKLRFVAVGLVALGLSACQEITKHQQPLDRALKSLIEQKGMTEDAPILVRLFKEESEFEVWKRDATGRFALLDTFEICRWSGKLGPKRAEGDRQAPEGFYTIRPGQMNPNSSYHLAFNLGYPNIFDQSHGRTGTHLMVHGGCSSRGCYAMTDENVQKIYTLARLAFRGGQREFQVQAFPFRLTPENMARHRNNENMAFWAMLKEGYDHFEVARQPVKVDVCERRYVFNAEGSGFQASARCPAITVPEPLRVAVKAKAERDEVQRRIIVAGLEAGDASPASSSTPPAASRTMLAATTRGVVPDGARLVTVATHGSDGARPVVEKEGVVNVAVDEALPLDTRRLAEAKSRGFVAKLLPWRTSRPHATAAGSPTPRGDAAAPGLYGGLIPVARPRRAIELDSYVAD